VNLQPTELANELVRLVPMQPADFNRLFAVASDPLIWEQHPEPDRYLEENFRKFFDSGIASGGAFLVMDAQTGALAGSSRYYQYAPGDSSVFIGYTFIARSYWGGPFNRALKELMINYAFEQVDKVLFHAGANNIRSQKAIQKLGAVKTGEQLMDGVNEMQRLNYIFELTRQAWRTNEG
jgi:RimJ/RimL family protein N-acetyltransferase